MATETDDKPAEAASDPAQNNAGPTVKSGDGGKVSGQRRLSLPKSGLPFGVENKRKLARYIIVAIAIIATIFIVARIFHIGEKVYAQADGHKVYKNEVDGLIDNDKNISDHQAATVLANKYLYQAMAKQAGITVSNKDVVAQYPNVNAKTTTKYLRQSEINNVYYSKLSAYNAGYYKGDVLVANFSRYIPFQSSLLEQQKSENPLIGNQQAINADKNYARKFIGNLYNQLVDHNITFNEAIQVERNDPRVGVKAYPELPHSGPFDTSNVFLGGTNLIGPQSAQPELAKIKQGQLSKPFAVSVRNSLTDSSVTAPAYYLIIQMDYSRSSHSGLPFDQWFAKEKKQYDYKVNV